MTRTARVARPPNIGGDTDDPQITVLLKHAKETRGAMRFSEIDNHGTVLATDEDGVVLVSLYIRKAALRKWLGDVPAPKKLKVVLEVIE